MQAIYFRIEIPSGVAVQHRALLATRSGIDALVAACKAQLGPPKPGRKPIPPELRCACGRFSIALAEKKKHRC